MADSLEAILKIVLKHDILTIALAQGFTEHAELLLQTCERCCCTGCKTAATVRHITLGLRCCDRCAAKLIVKARKLVGLDPNPDINKLRRIVIDEEAWLDVPGAIGIRRAQDIVTLAGHGREADVPEPGSMEWM
jgi:hypothetical protein